MKIQIIILVLLLSGGTQQSIGLVQCSNELCFDPNLETDVNEGWGWTISQNMKNNVSFDYGMSRHSIDRYPNIQITLRKDLKGLSYNDVNRDLDEYFNVNLAIQSSDLKTTETDITQSQLNEIFNLLDTTGYNWLEPTLVDTRGVSLNRFTQMIQTSENYTKLTKEVDWDIIETHVHSIENEWHLGFIDVYKLNFTIQYLETNESTQLYKEIQEIEFDTHSGSLLSIKFLREDYRESSTDRWLHFQASRDIRVNYNNKQSDFNFEPFFYTFIVAIFIVLPVYLWDRRSSKQDM